MLPFWSFSLPGQQLLKTEASVRTALCLGGTFPPPTVSQYTGQLITQILLFEWIEQVVKWGLESLIGLPTVTWVGSDSVRRWPGSPSPCGSISFSPSCLHLPYKYLLYHLFTKSYKPSLCGFKMLQTYTVGYGLGTQNRPMSLPHQNLLWSP